MIPKISLLRIMMPASPHGNYSILLPLKHMTLCFHSVSYSVQRGGVNLAKRHTRLNLRHPLQSSALPCDRPVENRHLPVAKTSLFRGLKIPQKPLPPNAEGKLSYTSLPYRTSLPQFSQCFRVDCCMSRCETCVYDLYIASLRRYRQDMMTLYTILAERRVSSQEWPKDIRLDVVNGDNVMDKEELAAEAAKRAFQVMNPTVDNPSWKTKDAMLEATKLVLWVLRGCRG